MADTPASIVDELRETALIASGESIRRGSLGHGLTANLAESAADIIERQAAENAEARDLVAMHQTLIEFQTAEIAALRAEIEALRAETAWRPVAEAERNEGEMVGVLMSDGTTDYAYWYTWEKSASEYHSSGAYLGEYAYDGGAEWMVHGSGPCKDPTMEDFDPDAGTVHVVKWCRLAPLPSPPAEG